MDALNPTYREQQGPRRRKRRQRNRLQAKFKSFLGNISDLSMIGPDQYFHALLNDIVEQPPTAVAFQVVANDNKPYTIVGVPTRIWTNPKAMRPLLEAKHRMRDVHRICILLPQEAIHAVPAMAADLDRMRQLFSTTDHPPPNVCAPHRAHNPAGCFAHFLAAGQRCLGSHQAT